MNREGIAYAVEVERVSGRLERILSSPLLGEGDDALGLIRLVGVVLQYLRHGNMWLVRLIRLDGPVGRP